MTSERRDLNTGPGKEHWWPIDDIERDLLAVLRVFLVAVAASSFDTSALVELQGLAAKPVPSAAGAITHTGYFSVTGVTGGSSPAKPLTLGLCAKTCPD